MSESASTELIDQWFDLEALLIRLVVVFKTQRAEGIEQSFDHFLSLLFR